MTSLPVRAAFFRVEPVKLDSLIQGAIQGTTGLPIPVPLPQRRPPNGHSTWLPKRFVVEVAEDEVKILDETGEGVEDAWARGHVDARVRVLDDHEVVVELRWPGADRHGRIEAEPTAEARAIAELLAHDTRVAQGSDRETDAALMSLAAETLPAELRRDRQAALRAIAVLVAPGERPLVVAEAASGVSFGIALLTDRTLNWWSGGRKEPVVVPRAEIVEAVVERPEDYGDLAVTDAGGRKIVLESLTPRDHASAIAELLGAELPEPAAPGLHAFLAATDEGLTRELRRELELLAALWDDGEEGRVLAIGFVGARIGALMLTDRRLLWAARKAEPISIERSAIAAPRLTRKLGAMRLDLTLHGGGEQRFDAVTPRERAEAMAAALLA